MCGIVGYVGKQNAAEVLVNGLQRLEYRGYDSAGVAVLNEDGVELRRSVGKLPALQDLLKQKPLHGTIGLGHTRWATHGRPSQANAHPHTCCQNKIAVVHNGIVENYRELKDQLEKDGHRFKSETDTEVLAHLIEEADEGDLMLGVRKALEHTRGSYALGVVSSHDPSRVIAARKDSPLVLGIGKEEMFLASDIPALLPYTRDVIFLEDGEIAELTPEGVSLYNLTGQPITRKPQTINWDPAMAQKAGYPHFMLKEIHEQSTSIQETFRGRISPEGNKILLNAMLPEAEVENIQRICLVGCGTSYHAALVARFWFEELAGLPCDVEMASEYRYRRIQKEPGTLLVAITQSGETADTLAAMRDCRRAGWKAIALCNVVGSTATREADGALYTYCGPEIGVASTKAFTGQLTALYLLALYLGQCRGLLSTDSIASFVQALAQVPQGIRTLLKQESYIQQLARAVSPAHQMLYLGRHLNYPIALEGALKMKEITYLHAEGYPAGEMKHGPIALIDDHMIAMGIVTESSVREKMLSNLEEVKARGGRIIAIATEGDTEVTEKADFSILIPRVHESVSPLLAVVPLQLLAYYVAVLRGCDVDQPRNLAKSVTVE